MNFLKSCLQVSFVDWDFWVEAGSVKHLRIRMLGTFKNLNVFWYFPISGYLQKKKIEFFKCPCPQLLWSFWVTPCGKKSSKYLWRKIYLSKSLSQNFCHFCRSLHYQHTDGSSDIKSSSIRSPFKQKFFIWSFDAKVQAGNFGFF